MKVCPKCGMKFSDETGFCPADGTTLESPPQQAAGQGASSGAYKVAGRFSLGELKERRTVGDLFSAHDEAVGRPVSLLLIFPHVLPSDAHKEQVLRELGQLMGLISSNVVKVLDRGTIEDGRVYAVLDSQIDSTLAGFVGSQGVLKMDHAVKILSDLASGLKAHLAAGLVHRELAPANVVMTSDSAMLLNLGVTIGLGNNVFGDPWFMAPEQTLGRPVDLRCNIYSLGALFYYVVTGSAPFQDADPNVLFDRHRNHQVEPPSVRRADLDIPPAVDAFVLKAMAKDANSRHLTLDVFIQEMKSLIGGGVDAPSTGVPPVVAAAAPQAAGQPVAPQAAGQPAAPQAAGQTATAQPSGEGAPARRGRRRRKKDDFRVTMWFKKGAVMEGDDEQSGSGKDDDLAEVVEGDGRISETEQSIDDRYKDDGSITREDQAAFSLRTGQTGMMPAVQMDDDVGPGKSMDEKAAVQSLDRSRKVWVVLVILLVLAAVGAFGAYIYVTSIPETFVQRGLHKILESKVPNFTYIPKIDMPAPPEYPEGEAKELWDSFVKLAEKDETILPAEGHGAGHYLVALERKIEEIRKAAQEKPKPRRRRGRGPSDDPFEQIAGPRTAKEAEKEFETLRNKVISSLRATVNKVKGKVYIGGGDEKDYIRALTAGRILLDLVLPFDERDGVARDKARLKTNFKSLEGVSKDLPAGEEDEKAEEEKKAEDDKKAEEDEKPEEEKSGERE